MSKYFRTENPYGYSDTLILENFETIATLWDKSGELTEVKDVKLNGVSLPREGRLYRTGLTQAFGSTQKWQVISDLSSPIPPLDDSIPAPNRFRITFPRPKLDTVSMRSGFTCRYQNPGTDSVEIGVWYDSTGTTLFFDSTLHQRTVPLMHKTIANTGSCFIEGSLLAAFPERGVIQIIIIALNRKFVKVSGRWYYLVSESRARTFSLIKK